MTPACRELEVLRSVYSAGGLEGEEAALVAAHLEGCPACREADRRDRELLGLVKLPAPTPAEERAWADLPGRTLGELRRRQRRAGWARRLGAALGVAAVAAAVVAMLLWPAVGKPPAAPAGPAQELVATTTDDGNAAFFDDDLDSDDDGSSAGSSAEIALAAFDAGVGN